MRPPTLVAFVLAAACRPAATTSPPGDPAHDGDGDSVDDDAEGRGDATADDRPRCGDGSPWTGRAAGCLYEHDGCCYASPRQLCEAAGCDPTRCRILEVQPAQARCEG